MSRHAIALGKTVAWYRKGLGISQDQLAERMGSTQGTVSRIENGLGYTSLDIVVKAAEALGLGISVCPAFPVTLPKRTE